MDDVIGRDPSRSAVAGKHIQAVRASGLFDAALYASRIGKRLPDDELIAHYLSEGEAQGIPASNVFDLNFYKAVNTDAAEYSGGLMLHYIKHGETEGRYLNLAELESDADKVKKSGLFSSPRSRTAPHVTIVLPPIETYLVSWRHGYRANDEFDDGFYASRYPDVQSYRKPPIIHYIDIGQKQGRLINEKQLAAAKAEIEPFFDAAFYRKNAGLPATGDDPVEHYLTVGRFRGCDPSPEFSVNYYRQRYSDIAQSGFDPFVHYVRFVKLRGENRAGRADLSSRIKRGGQLYDAGKSTVLIVNHEASRTGAPLVGLEAARHFSHEHNVLIYSQGDGELIDEFAAASVEVILGAATPADAEDLLGRLRDTYHLDAILLNSVETSAFAKAALYAGIPTVALIHEFSEYTFPAGRMARMVAAVDRAIVPARLVLESVQRDVEREFGFQAQNLVVRPQGCLPALPGRHSETDLDAGEILTRLKATSEEKPPIVLGAGFVHIRKGIELFVQAAHEVRRHINDVRFVWVGAGYEPRQDGVYSVWVAEAVRRLGLEDTVFFLPPQGEMDLLFELSDVFFLSSRMDPFPSIVLDALEAGKQVVCFENATGAADLFRNGTAYGAAVEYGNVNAAAEAIVDILRAPADDASRVNRALIETSFRFTDYCEFLEQEIGKAIASRIRLEEACARLSASKAFDAEFHDGGEVIPLDTARACRDYVACGMKGLAKYNPRPGFSDGLYRSRDEEGAGAAALDHALVVKGDTQGPPSTHRCVILKHRAFSSPPVGRIGLHVHLHYATLVPEFVQRLNNIAQPIDVFVTTSGRNERVEIEYHFLRYGHGEVHCIEVPNRGRDIGPFLTHLEEPLTRGNYDIVGHLHGKRSIAIDAAMGDRWRLYLLDTLLGDTFSRLANLFVSDQELGLVFAEDRHSAGWNDNYDVAQKLAQKMKPALSNLPKFPYFPLGTMFWARPAAIAPLWRLGLRTNDFPAEPVPYDGTILHALERMLPAVCESAGYSWCTVLSRKASW